MFGYRVEALQRVEGKGVLHVARTEALSAETLHWRNMGFNDLATHCGVDLYDWCDVGMG
jgi:hypothetical protein